MNHRIPSTVALVLLFMLPAVLAGPGDPWGFLLVFGTLGTPLCLLWFAYHQASGRTSKALVLLLAVAFAVIDVPLFLGAGFAAPVVGIVQSAIAAVLAAALWLLRKRAA